MNSIELGYITSTTIMANGEAFDEACTYAKSNARVSYGVHLVLDELRPLTYQHEFVKNGIVDKEGYFVKGQIFKVRISKHLKQAIYEEWSAQIDKLINNGVMPSHMDSHHHVHNIFGLESVLKRLSERYQIWKVRNSNWLPISLKRNMKDGASAPTTPSANKSERKSIFGRIVKYIINGIAYYKIRHDFVTTDFFTSAKKYFLNQSLIEKQRGINSIELMCHPGHPNYEEEFKMLKANLLYFEDLITYNDINSSK
jgi:predicted glycoside hydrolase/deacetylase ChbG (UPF0249 family)